MFMSDSANENISFDRLIKDYASKYSDKHEFFASLERLLSLIMKRIKAVEAVCSVKVEEESPEEEWITFDELISRYPFAKTNSMHLFVCYSSDDCDYYREPRKGCFLFNPKKLFTYIYKNRKRHWKFHSRLRKVNFYGFLA